jgi:hypothetical protein
MLADGALRWCDQPDQVGDPCPVDADVGIVEAASSDGQRNTWCEFGMWVWWRVAIVVAEPSPEGEA